MIHRLCHTIKCSFQITFTKTESDIIMPRKVLIIKVQWLGKLPWRILSEMAIRDRQLGFIHLIQRRMTWNELFASLWTSRLLVRGRVRGSVAIVHRLQRNSAPLPMMTVVGQIRFRLVCPIRRRLTVHSAFGHVTAIASAVRSLVRSESNRAAYTADLDYIPCGQPVPPWTTVWLLWLLQTLLLCVCTCDTLHRLPRFKNNTCIKVMYETNIGQAYTRILSHFAIPRSSHTYGYLG